MKKAPAHVPASSPGRVPIIRRVRLAGGLAAASLIAGLGLLASRPAHTAGGPIAVSVANTPLATIPTDEAAPRQPFQGSTTYVIKDHEYFGDADSDDGFNEIKVPAGKRLMIQTVSIRKLSNNNEDIRPIIVTNVNAALGAYSLPNIHDTGAVEPGITQALTLSGDAGTTIHFALYRTGTTGKEYLDVSIYGYLVNI